MELIPIQRFVNADNSCLFSTISYLIDKKNFNESSSLIFRLTIVDYINEKTDITDEFLGMSKKEYILKMENPDCWGGAIELKLFSDIFKIQIASIDIQSGRVDIFGETENYTHIIYILYNGNHYDPLVMSIDGTSGDFESDITIFELEDYDKLIKFKDYAEKLKKERKFVDLSNNSNYQCTECKEIFTTEKNAMTHGELNNHWTFDEV
jgi:ubiquitin thioesterase OTU1